MRAANLPLLLVLLLGGCPTETLIDVDGDGYFANSETEEFVDCDDLDAAMFPTNTEICDGLDNDCNDLIDDEAEGAVEWWPDEDRDGYGYGTPDQTGLFSCVRPEGYATTTDDCNDADGGVHPNAIERCNDLDDNCDTQADEGILKDTAWFLDRDRDGYGGGEMVGEGCQLDDSWVRTNDDCNDVVDAIRPGAPEVCDNADNDCDGLVDGDDPDITGARTYFLDGDGDGYGDVLSSLKSCTRPDMMVDNFDDCNDADDDQNPETTWYLDDDRDGFGVPQVTWPHRQCWQPIGYSINAYDCDDADRESWGIRPWYPDADRDGFGGPQVVGYGCVQQVGWVREPTDCDDRDPSLKPDNVEICDTIDNDCDGLIDINDDDTVGISIFYPDADGDGYGINFAPVLECFEPTGYADNADDCNDTNAVLNPGARWWIDSDRDGFGDPDGSYTISCTPLPGRAPNNDDCDDDDFDYSPASRWYTDLDRDGIGTGVNPAAVGCIDDADQLASRSGDCDDNDDNEVTGDCYGPQRGLIELVVLPDNDSLRTGVEVRCQGVGSVISGETSPANANTPVTLTAEVAAGINCQLTFTVNVQGDPTGDGGVIGELSMCGVSVGTFPAPAIGVFTSAPFPSTACSGCLDPAAENYDPSKLIDNGACIYE